MRWLRLVRTTHLVLGLLIVPVCLVYAVSALQMSYRGVLKARSVRTQWQAEIGPELRDPRSVLEALRQRHGVRGDLVSQRSTEGGERLFIVRPGTEYRVTVPADGGPVEVDEKRYGFLGRLNRIHHVAGVWWETSATNLWGGALLVLSVALMILGVTGVLLWLQHVRERRGGLIVLGLSFGYAAGLLWLIRFA